MIRSHILTISCLLLLFMGVFLSSPELTSCGSKKFLCQEENVCIPVAWTCDGETDCKGGSDELECDDETDCSNSFRCLGSKDCILMNWRCDGEKDCKDGSDEDNCTTIHCPDDGSHFSCGLQQLCLHVDHRCDGVIDCSNGVDEEPTLCANKTCQDSEFKCSDNRMCIFKKWVCDGEPDCADKSDEIHCDEVVCGINQYTCLSKYPRCIDKELICNGIDNCADGSDELECSIPDPICPPGESLCKLSKECVSTTLFCDGNEDCLGGTDETNCSHIKCNSDEFQCKSSRRCIPSWFRCNGILECEDRSDEERCPGRVCDERKQFNCSQTKDSICILLEKTCDGFSDCPRSEDEDKVLCSGDDVCDDDTPCKHGRCVQHGHKKICDCAIGFQWSPLNKICQDVNECLRYNLCSQICVNKAGTYKCLCHPGYELDTLNHKICRAKDGEPKLLFTILGEMRYLEMRQHNYHPLLKHPGEMKAIDFESSSNTLLISDYFDGSIHRVNMTHPDDVKLIWRGFGSRSVEDMTYDWVYKNIYVVMHHSIDMLHLAKNGDVYKKNIVKDSPDTRYQGAIVDPRSKHNYFYWAVVGKTSMIMRSSLDGSDAFPFVSSHILSPSSLTIDFETDAMYWVDAKLHTINRKYLNIDDKDQFVIFTNFGYVRQPLSIDFFEGHVFWSEQLGRIYSIDVTMTSSSRSQNVLTIKDNLNFLSDIKVLHDLRQPKVEHNVCEKHVCSHICLPNPQDGSKYVCHFPVEVLGPKDHPVTMKPQKNSVSLVIGIAITLMIAVFGAFMLVLRKMRKKNTKAMNFTNPVYRKQQMDDEFSLFKNQTLSAAHLLHSSEAQVTRPTEEVPAKISEPV